MRILFVAPRFHTNQCPTAKGLVEHGHEVFYLVQTVGVSEDHSYVEPQKMKISLLGRLVRWFILKRNNRTEAETKMIHHYIPSFWSVFGYIKRIRPDIVILRDRIPSTILANLACKLLGIKKVVLYNQTSLYSRRSQKQHIGRRIVFALMPKVRYTVTYIRNIFDLTEHKDDLYVKEHEYFVPFVCPLNEAAEQRSYFGEDSSVRILCMGKYRSCKNHSIVVDAIALLRKRGLLDRVTVTMLGQVFHAEEEAYFAALGEYVKEKGVDDVITLRRNIPYSEMPALYQSHDVYILPSITELASISILEAMGNALVPISTSYNGTACYITEGENGYVFRNNDAESLAGRIETLISDRSIIPVMGRAGYRYMKENCMFENYFSALNELFEKEFSVSLDQSKV